jgi:hypothetical protein
MLPTKVQGPSRTRIIHRRSETIAKIVETLKLRAPDFQSFCENKSEDVPSSIRTADVQGHTLSLSKLVPL